MVAFAAGANFTPHVLTVAAGGDVSMKIISFCQQGPKALCILSGTGTISSVTLRSPDSSGGTLTHEGRFEILSLSGSFIPTEDGDTRSRAGGMSVSLVSSDGRVVAGGVAGHLVAAGPVQVVMASFLPTYHVAHKTEVTASVSIPAAEFVLFNSETETNGGGQMQRSTPSVDSAPDTKTQDSTIGY